MPYLFPLTVLTLPLVSMVRLVNNPGDKEGMATIAIVTTTSLIVLYT